MAKVEKDAHEPKEDFNAFLNLERGLSRRSFIKSASVMTAAVMLPPFFKPSVAQAAASRSDTFVYVGCWQPSPSDWAAPPNKGKGFGIFKYNPKTGDLELIKSSVFDYVSVGQTCLDAKRNILYCIR